ncbi:MAG: Crp/Fnr family transcriptional regulator [Cyclobacteriaceae bacterium]
MKEYLTKIESQLNGLDEKAKEALSSVTHIKKYKKGDYLLQQGEVCKNSFLIQQGVARKFYLTEEKEITTELFFENDIAVSLQSYTSQQPSHEFVQAIENVTVSVTNYQAFQKIKKQHTSLLELDLMLTEYYAMWLEERLFLFHSMDATQRYQLLLSEQPHFIQQIPLTYLASYLGISLETLSRIRAKI